jgi:hypothetical protein
MSGYASDFRRPRRSAYSYCLAGVLHRARHRRGCRPRRSSRRAREGLHNVMRSSMQGAVLASRRQGRHSNRFCGLRTPLQRRSLRRWSLSQLLQTHSSLRSHRTGTGLADLP